MENGVEFSSHLNLGSSSCISNSSNSIPIIPSDTGDDDQGNSLQLLSLSRLSSGLEKLLIEPDEYDYGDADIVVEGISVGVNRGILAARSQFFHEKFKEAKKDCDSGRPKFLMSELVSCGWVGYEAFMVLLNYVYTGKMKESPPEVSTCVDECCDHFACRPAIDYAVQLMYGSVTFQIKELVMLIQRGLDCFVYKAVVEDVIPILLVAFHCSLSQLLEHCVQRVTHSNLDNFILEKELPREICSDIKARRLEQTGAAGQVETATEKKIRNILRALDSDDVELVKMLLEEAKITLDNACALHYAAAYCNSKIVNEVLGLGPVDLNRRNAQGYTVLHVAARRKDPTIIVGILDKIGGSARDATCNGQSAVTICRRSTRPKDYNKATEEGEEKNNDRLCIDVLEGVMNGNPMMVGSIEIPSSTTMENDLVMELYFLENRVALAKTLYPREAKINMEIAHADSTLEFAGLSSMEGFCGNLKGVGLTGLPPDQVKRLKERREALKKTVELGRRFFGNCSDVLNKLTVDDVLDSLMLESGTPEEQTIKKRRFMELKEEVMIAFDKDMAQNKVGFSSCSSSSTSPKMSATRKFKKRIK